MKPSERVLVKLTELLRSDPCGVHDARWSALLAYLDEREAQLHPIARAHPVCGHEAGGLRCQLAPEHSPNWHAQDQLRIADKTVTTLVAAKDEFERRGAKAESDLVAMQALRAEDGSKLCDMVSLLEDSDAKLREAQAEITRLKEENARLSGERDVRQERLEENLRQPVAVTAAERDRYRSKYHAARREVRRLNATVRLCNLQEIARSEATRELGKKHREAMARLAADLDESNSRLEFIALERGRTPSLSNQVRLDEMCRSMALSALARAEGERTEAPNVCGTVSRSGRMSCTEPTGHDGPCADKGDAFAVATPPEPPAPVEAPREIRVGSKWKNDSYGHVRTITKVTKAEVFFVEPGGFTDQWDSAFFPTKHTWLSDPPMCENCVLGGDEAPEPGKLRDGTGEGDVYLCDDCYREWQRSQAEGQQW